MKIIRYAAGAEARWGAVEGDEVYALPGNPAVDPSLRPGARVGTLSGLSLLAPVAPTKLLAVGRNYMKHIDEMAARGPSNLPPRPLNPTFFLKPNSAIIGPGANIVYPTGRAELVEHEAELALVIGKRGRKIAEADALSHVFGYLCANDVSARGLGDDGQWMRGKGFDTFAPLGPCVVTGLDASDLRITARLNGVTKQDSRTNDLLFKIPQLIAFISQAMTLEAGDVILTGTPSGVSAMKPGDVIEIEIEGIGTLRNSVVADH